MNHFDTNNYSMVNGNKFMFSCQYGTISEINKYINLEKPNNKTLYIGLKWCSIKGDIDKFKYLLSLKDNSNNFILNINNDIFKLLCSYKHLHIIKYIINNLNNPIPNKFIVIFNLNKIIPQCMSIASYNGDYALLKYLYEVMISYDTIKPNFTELFINVCNVGNLESLEFLLSIPNNKIDIHYNNDYAFHISFHKNYIDIIKYLFRLSNSFNATAYNNKVYKVACAKNNIELVKLIKDYNNNMYNNNITKNNVKQATKLYIYDYKLNKNKSEIIKCIIDQI